MESKSVSLTDEIYAELVDGLKTGLDWTHFLAKHNASKGPLYNAIGRFFNELEPKVKAANEVRVQLDQAGPKLESLDEKIKEAESDVARLEDTKNTLNHEIGTLETKLGEKTELARHLAELGKLGFDLERLRQLQETLAEIGMKHGLKGKQAVTKFFDDLKDYGAIVGAELQLRGLQTQIETKKLEAENWQAKEEVLRRKHDDLKEAVGAVHALRTRGVKVGQIITWHRILNRFETADQFDESLTRHGDVAKLLNAMKQETEDYEMRLAKVQSQVETLQKERARIEAAIEALKVAGVKEVKAMAEAAEKQVKAAAAKDTKEIRAMSQEARSEFSSYLAQIDQMLQNVFQAGQKFERLSEELEKYQGVKDVLESHASASETEK